MQFARIALPLAAALLLALAACGQKGKLYRPETPAQPAVTAQQPPAQPPAQP